MAGTFAKKWPVPILRPMWPFFAAGGIVFYGMNALASTLANTDEFKNDPRNPALQNPKSH